MSYQNTTFDAMKTYNSASMQRQATQQKAAIQKQKAYSSSVRRANNTYVLNVQNSGWDMESNLIDAAFAEFRNTGELEFLYAEDLLDRYDIRFEAAGGNNGDGNYGSLLDSFRQTENDLSSLLSQQLEAQKGLRVQNELNIKADAENQLGRAELDLLRKQAALNVEYLSQYDADYADEIAADAEDYVAYMTVVNNARKEYEAEQCRLAGLLQDSVDTEYNVVSSYNNGTSIAHAFFAGGTDASVIQASNANGLPDNNINDDDIRKALKLDSDKSYRLVLAARAIQGVPAKGTGIRHGFLMIQVEDKPGEWKNTGSISWHPDHWDIGADESAPGRVWINDPLDTGLPYVEGYDKKDVNRFFVITNDKAVIDNFVKKLPDVIRKQNVGVEIGKEIPINDQYGYGSEGHRNSNLVSRYYNLTGYNCFNASHVLLEETGKSLPSKTQSELNSAIQSTKENFSSKYNLNPNVNVKPRVLTIRRLDMVIPEAYGTIPADY